MHSVSFCYTIHHFNSLFPPVQDLQRLTQRFDTLPESLEQCKQDLHSYDVGTGAPEFEKAKQLRLINWSTDQDYQLWKVLGWTVELEKRGFDDLTRIKERCSWCLCARRSPCTEHVSTLCQRQTGCKNEQFWVEAGVAWFSKYRRYIHITELMGKAVSFNSFTQPVFPLCRLLQLSSWRVWMRKRESPDDSIKLLLFTFPARFLLGYCLHMQ